MSHRTSRDANSTVETNNVEPSLSELGTNNNTKLVPNENGRRKSLGRVLSKKKKRNRSFSGSSVVGRNQPLEFPCTPELLLEHHKQNLFLSKNEEWLVIELNEYECLIDGLEIIEIIAKHSEFFEIEPDELWEEFFEFIEEVPSYDEIINYDVWQEFRDKKYPC